jgi:hypothetical protein
MALAVGTGDGKPTTVTNISLQYDDTVLAMAACYGTMLGEACSGPPKAFFRGVARTCVQPLGILRHFAPAPCLAVASRRFSTLPGRLQACRGSRPRQTEQSRAEQHNAAKRRYILFIGTQSR